jgi:hypothetical protein
MTVRPKNVKLNTFATFATDPLPPATPTPGTFHQSCILNDRHPGEQL